MNKIFGICAGVFITMALQAAAPEKTISTAIEEVSVFRQGAQVMRTGQGMVPAGQSVLKFTGLPADLDPASIQFSATGDFTILSVAFQRNFINPLEKNEAVVKLEDQLEALQDKLNRELADLQVLTEEENLILANKNVGSQQNGVSMEDLQALAEYYRKRLKEIKLEKLEVDKRKKAIQEDLDKVRQQLNATMAQFQKKASGEVLVNTLADAAVNAKFSLSYLSRSAGWKPSYDLKVTSVSQPVSVQLKAEVFQNTGEDWTGVKLSLSTGNPSEPGTRPELQIWRLYPNQPVVAYDRAGQGYLKKERMEMDAMSAPPMVEEEAAEANFATVSAFEQTTTRQYKIDVPYDIPGDGQEHTVRIGAYELPATYRYYAAPKLDLNAYLTARITNWDEYNLLPGQANLYLEGAFLGKTWLNPSVTQDTLEVSLGRDKGIVITRTKDRQYKDKQALGSKITQTIGWDIEVRNTKSQAIDIVIVDQVPVTATDEVEVKLENSRGAAFDETTGKLTWEEKIKSGATSKLNFRYAVKYPKRLPITLE